MNSYNHKPRYFCLLENAQPQALLPIMEVKTLFTGKRGVSLPFSDFCEPLAVGLKAFDTLYASALHYGRNNRWQTLSLRGGSPYLAPSPSREHFIGHVLPLDSDPETVFNRLRNSTRRNVLKARKLGVQVSLNTDRESLQSYYDLHCLTRKRHGVPPQPHYFFARIHDQVIAHGQGFIVLAHHQDRYIAGAVFLHFGRHALYKFGASDPEHFETRANNLVMWSAIEWYSRNGYSHLHLGRTDLDNTGLVQFKNGWGTKTYPMDYHRWNFRTGSYDSPRHRIPRHFLSPPGEESARQRRSNSNSHFSFYPRDFTRHLPLPLLKMAGKWIYPHAA